METIEANERRMLLKALDIAGPALIRGDAATPEELTELRGVLADEQVRLILGPEERVFSVPVRISVLAADAEEAERMVKLLVEEAAGNFDFENFIAFEAGPARDLLTPLQTAYGVLADIRHDWPGRHTTAGQALLIGLRDAIAGATGMVAEDVQHELGRSTIHQAGG